MEEKFNFDEIIQRRNTNSLKWDSCEDPEVLPLWVADMDFKAAPCILRALQRRLNHGVFGYVKVPESFYQSAINWFQTRHSFSIQREWMLYTSGVVPAISAIIKAVCRPGEKVLVQTPVFNCFFSSIRNNGCQIEDSPLVYQNRTYHIDFEDFERHASQPDVKAFLLCNPHNPAGRVWTRSELEQMGEICLRHGVFVISDEIHCEITFPDHPYSPFASISPEFLPISATCLSPSKAFNIAGLQISVILASDPETQQRIDRAININEVCDVNPFGVEAFQAAYNEGGPWLDALNQYIRSNYNYLVSFFRANLPQLSVTKLEGTYLAWVDCGSPGLDSPSLCQKLRTNAKVMLSDSLTYGEQHHSFIRINLACPRTTLHEALLRITRVLRPINSAN